MSRSVTLLTVFAVVVVVGLFSTVRAQTCVALSTSPLQSNFNTQVCPIYVIAMTQPSYQVFVPASDAISNLDTMFTATQVSTFLSLLPAPPVACAIAAAYFACPGVYRNCTGSSPPEGVPVCKTVCDNFIYQCSTYVNVTLFTENYESYQLVIGGLPNCNGNDPATGLPYATSGCTDIYTYNAQQNINNTAPAQQNVTCLAPLIPNPGLNASDIPPHNCIGQCCIPCPLTRALYPEGQIDAVNIMADVVSVVSLICSLITVTSYLVLPHKRGYPSHIILNLAIALCLFYITVFFNFGPYGRSLTQCENWPNNKVDLALPGYTTNPWTIAQGVFVVYGILAAVIWYGFLVLNIFISVVFLNTRLGDYPVVYHVINWLLPWASVIVALCTHQLGYLGLSTWVVLNNGWWMDGILMIPIALVIFPSVILNSVTLVRISLVGLRRNATYRQILRLQMRPFLFVLVILFIFLVYWIHYEIALRVTPSEAFIATWYTCIQSGGSQSDCFVSSGANLALPSYGAYFFGELVVNSVGLVIFAFFVLRRDVLMGWYYFLTVGADASFFNNSYIGSGNGSSKANNQADKRSASASAREAVRMSELQDVDKTIESLKTTSPLGNPVYQDN